MSRSTRNAGKAWTEAARAQLRTLAAHNTPTRVIGLKLGRSESAGAFQGCWSARQSEPTNQSPYGTSR